VLAHISDSAQNLPKPFDKDINSKKSSTESLIQQDSVDLDNIFAFLGESDTTIGHPLIEEINDEMNNLVKDLDDEVS